MHRDQQLLAELYLRYYEMLYGVCFKYLQDHDSSKDAVLGIYEALVTKLGEHQVDNVRGWLYVFARNHCLMQMRKDKRILTKEISDSDMYSEDILHPVNALLKEKQLNSLEDCIEALGAVQRSVIRKFYLEEKSYNEIVSDMGLEWNKVRSLVQNGRRNLKICMEQNEE